jgi:hypothetical protein
VSSTSDTNRRTRRAAVGSLIAVIALTAIGGSARAQEAPGDEISIDGAIDGERLAESSSNEPISLESDVAAELELDVINRSDIDVDLSRVRLEGRALGVVFVAYDAAVAATVRAGEREVLEIPLRFYDLDDQATGLLPATLTVFDANGDPLARQDFTIDVRGDLASIVGVFTVVVITATLLGALLLARQIAARRLPANRWHRALQFAPVGLGIGLIFTIALAVLRIAAPYGSVWVPLLVLPTGIAFALGYVAPGPLSPEEEDDDEGDDGDALGSIPVTVPQMPARDCRDTWPRPRPNQWPSPQPNSWPSPRPLSGTRG